MREFLGTIEGAADHAADWLDNIDSALASEGAHNVHDLAGGNFDDFAFSGSSLNGAARRLIRQAIEQATAGQAALLGAPSSGVAAAASAASAATAAIAEFLQKKEEAGHQRRRLRDALAAMAGNGTR